MELYIDTADRETVTIACTSGSTHLEESIQAPHRQAEHLLPAIERMLKRAGKTPADIKAIRVADSGDSFTALRIGVTTANALAYALGCSVRGTGDKALVRKGITAVAPRYSKPPTIHKKK